MFIYRQFLWISKSGSNFWIRWRIFLAIFEKKFQSGTALCMIQFRLKLNSSLNVEGQNLLTMKKTEDFSKVLTNSEKELLVRLITESQNWKKINILRQQIESQNEEIVKYKQELFDIRCLSRELLDENSYLARENQNLIQNIQRKQQWYNELNEEISKFLL